MLRRCLKPFKRHSLLVNNSMFSFNSNAPKGIDLKKVSKSMTEKAKKIHSRQ